jgi:hypothetical protein
MKGVSFSRLIIESRVGHLAIAWYSEKAFGCFSFPIPYLQIAPLISRPLQLFLLSLRR